MGAYSLFFSLILFFSRLTVKHKYVFRCAVLLCLILFTGLRYKVGRDYESYEEMFYLHIYTNNPGLVIEPGYLIIYDIVASFSEHFYWVTILTAIIQFVFFYLGIRKFQYFTLSLFFFLMSMEGWAFTVNGMRQGIAACIFCYALTFLLNKKYWLYVSLIIVASLFHVSALILLPIALVLRIKLKDKWYFNIFIVFLLLSQTDIVGIVLMKIIEFTPYANYLLSDFVNKTSTDSGLGFCLINLLGAIVLFRYKRLMDLYPQFLVYFNLFFLYMISRNIFFSVAIFMRLLPYWAIGLYVIYPIAIHKAYTKSFALPFKTLLISSYIAMFIMWVLSTEQFYQMVIL